MKMRKFYKNSNSTIICCNCGQWSRSESVAISKYTLNIIMDSSIFIISLQFSCITSRIIFHRKSKTKRPLPIIRAIWIAIIVYVHNLYAIQLVLVYMGRGKQFKICKFKMKITAATTAAPIQSLYMCLFFVDGIMRTKIRPVAIKQNICSQHVKRMRFIKFVRKPTLWNNFEKHIQELNQFCTACNEANLL